MRRACIIIVLFFAACQQTPKESDDVNITYFSLNREADDVVYRANESIVLDFTMSTSGEVKFVDESHKIDSYRRLGNDVEFKKKAGAELKYSLAQTSDSTAIVTISVYGKDSKGAFVIPKMNVGETSFAFQGREDLKDQLNYFLALVTFKFSPEE